MPLSASRRFRPLGRAAALSTLLVVASGSAFAQWEGSVGAGVFSVPEYLGSDDHETRAWPSVSVTYGDTFYASVRDGIGLNLFRQGNWEVSPFISYLSGRDNDGELSGLDKVDDAAALGVRARYSDGPWGLEAATRTPLGGDIDGYDAELKASWQTMLSEQMAFSVGPELTYSSDDWTEDMFGISPVESARSGLAVYRPNDGYLRMGLTSRLSYYLSRDWSVTGLMGITRLTGDAADSPIVDDVGNETQVMGGALINYHF
ncbi:MipA/OmpV family protein [Halomonas sp. CUBES01]|uniref:MipA/OmpV family protein n=1 Tax=Vreelandella gomseomensis TaxID=370766 RepID=A0ABU1GGD7_9GAMM|nr:MULTISPECIES: MipA/OmpV family protein [Halomonas]MDR5876541.1 MipA/OmpV family protein [Halomonas gomseomensis]MEC4767980.1 MipA/OmpV family protein [Halomonas sp. CUBES01]